MAKTSSDTILSEIVGIRREKCASRLEDIAPSMRTVYLKAIKGESRAAAVKAMCQQCVCWQRQEITQCSALSCPLWSYRPYQSETESDGDVVE